MLKNNKGYLLTETIIAITIVATVITVVYAVIMNNLVKQNNEITKNNTVYGMFILKEVRKYYSEREEGFNQSLADNDYIDITANGPAFFESIDVYKLYYLKYDKINTLIENEKIPYNVKKELKDEDTSRQKCDYRYLLIFKETGSNENNKLFDYSYATMGSNCSK